MNKNDCIIIRGDLNVSVVKVSVDNIVRNCGKSVINDFGQQLIDYACCNNFRIMDIYSIINAYIK